MVFTIFRVITVAEMRPFVNRFSGRGYFAVGTKKRLRRSSASLFAAATKSLYSPEELNTFLQQDNYYINRLRAN